MRSNTIRVVFFISILFSIIIFAVAYGSVGHSPAANSYANQDEWAQTPGQYIGEEVEVSGIVTSTDPYTISTDFGIDGTMQVTVEGVENDITKGEELSAFGTLTDNRHLIAHRTSHRNQWETEYMYLISALGVLWVVRRIFQGWTVNRSQLGIEPRQTRRKQATDDTDA